ncbi:LysE family translocator [Sphingobium terrigena]|uniref:LysE family translocator n=1 Tax=Sphingobium terrigena TaxID=2304063 RepID=A0A418YTU0_9SPHN|nr:LysE family translocator [Sphingobium terrigena]RJG55471.1 LysE family translocator [Sphingobium terrigena]
MDWMGFALTVLVIELTPGPNMAWLAMLAATRGRRMGLAAALGTTLGLAINGLLAAAGLAVILSTTPWLWTMLRWAGAALMLWLAADAWRDAAPSSPTARQQAGLARQFATGAMINLLNPKAFLFYVLIAPPFLPDGKLTFPIAMMLTMISVSIATAIHIVIILLGAGAHRWLGDPARTRLVRRIMAVGLVGVAGWFLLSTGL